MKKTASFPGVIRTTTCLLSLLLLVNSAHASCGSGTCQQPSQAQADALFGKIETLYPSLLIAASASTAATQSQVINGNTAYLRNYSGNISLATYQGGLWFAQSGQWQRHGSLDAANQLYCNATCWSGSSKTVQFNLAQTLSEGAQRTTLAFSGLAMMTGNLNAQSFFPPGKVADYTGFQYLRDNDPDDMGHNTSFLTRVAYNVIVQLSDAQFDQLKALAVAQDAQVKQYGYQRFTLMQAFRRQLEGNVPVGSSLSLAAVKAASRSLYEIDGQISFDRAVRYADILNNLSASQKAAFDAIKGKGWKSWPDISDAQVQARLKTLPQGTAVAVMTYAGDLFSWYAGSLEADVYFCPERHGTYFGSFYLKDAPAVGHEGYSINEQLTATAGRVLSESSEGYVTAAQASQMAALVSTQSSNLKAIVSTRTAIATLLRSLLGSSQDSTGLAALKAQVLALSATYGELDGANNHAYATSFASVYQSLSSSQKNKLAALRKSILAGTYADGGTYDYSLANTPYLYSDPLSDSTALATYIGQSDSLFAQ